MKSPKKNVFYYLLIITCLSNKVKLKWLNNVNLFILNVCMGAVYFISK